MSATRTRTRTSVVDDDSERSRSPGRATFRSPQTRRTQSPSSHPGFRTPGRRLIDDSEEQNVHAPFSVNQFRPSDPRDPRSPRSSPRPNLPFGFPVSPSLSRLPSSPPLQDIVNRPETPPPSSRLEDEAPRPLPGQEQQGQRRIIQVQTEPEETYPSPSTTNGSTPSPPVRRTDDASASMSSSTRSSVRHSVQENIDEPPVVLPSTPVRPGQRIVPLSPTSIQAMSGGSHRTTGRENVPVSSGTILHPEVGVYFPSPTRPRRDTPIVGPRNRGDGVMGELEGHVVTLLERMRCPLRGYSLRAYLDMFQRFVGSETRFLPPYVREFFTANPRNYADLENVVRYVGHPMIQRELRRLTGTGPLRGFEVIIDLPPQIRSFSRNTTGELEYTLYPQGQGTLEEVIDAIEERVDHFILAMNWPVRRQVTNTYLALFQSFLDMPEDSLPTYALEYLTNSANRVDLNFFIHYTHRPEIQRILRDLPAYDEIVEVDNSVFNTRPRSPTPEPIGNAGNTWDAHYDRIRRRYLLGQINRSEYLEEMRTSAANFDDRTASERIRLPFPESEELVNGEYVPTRPNNPVLRSTTTDSEPSPVVFEASPRRSESVRPPTLRSQRHRSINERYQEPEFLSSHRQESNLSNSRRFRPSSRYPNPIDLSDFDSSDEEFPMRSTPQSVARHRGVRFAASPEYREVTPAASSSRRAGDVCAAGYRHTPFRGEVSSSSSEDESNKEGKKKGKEKENTNAPNTLGIPTNEHSSNIGRMEFFEENSEGKVRRILVVDDEGSRAEETTSETAQTPRSERAKKFPALESDLGVPDTPPRQAAQPPATSSSATPNTLGPPSFDRDPPPHLASTPTTSRSRNQGSRRIEGDDREESEERMKKWEEKGKWKEGTPPTPPPTSSLTGLSWRSRSHSSARGDAPQRAFLQARNFRQAMAAANDSVNQAEPTTPVPSLSTTPASSIPREDPGADDAASYGDTTRRTGHRRSGRSFSSEVVGSYH
ncbi:hypothetical protein PQX77_002082, partial [Marasmius sp. AFHP31]